MAARNRNVEKLALTHLEAHTSFRVARPQLILCIIYPWLLAGF